MPRFYKTYKIQELEDVENKMNILSQKGWIIKDFFFQSKIEKYVFLAEIECEEKPIEFEEAKLESQGVSIETYGNPYMNMMGNPNNLSQGNGYQSYNNYQQNSNQQYGSGLSNTFNYNQSDGFQIYTGK